jgi:prepilin-type N-terminal cleavage/methylation domain-containing protein
MKNENGFSLVELLIVVAIIAIIAAIAVPSLLTSRMAANEASAVQGCRTIGSAEIAFAATNNQQFTELADLVTGQFLDSRFSDAANVINGYSYQGADVPVEGGNAFTANLPTAFAFNALPGQGLGRFTYGIGPDQVVRYVGFQDPAAALPTGSIEGTPIGKNN